MFCSGLITVCTQLFDRDVFRIALLSIETQNNQYISNHLLGICNARSVWKVSQKQSRSLLKLTFYSDFKNQSKMTGQDWQFSLGRGLSQSRTQF